MIRAKLDKIENLKLTERNGSLTRVVRVAVVSGLEEATDWTSLRSALAAAEPTPVPEYGDHLSEDPSDEAYNLVVIDRDVEMTDKGMAEVTITYENALNSDNVEDRIDNPFIGLMTGEVRCVVQQVSSNLDANGNQVILSHAYPADDKNYPNQTRHQGGEFQYYQAQRSFSIHGIKYTNTPWVIANAITGRVNFSYFSGEQPRTWMCMGATWKPESNHDGLARYYMRFEFQFNPDTWDPTLVYHDDSTGKPPVNLVPGVGIKTIQKHQAVDFEYTIGTLIHGA